VDNVLTRSELPTFGLVFSGHYEEREGALVEHFLQDVPDCMALSGSDFIGFDGILVLLVEMVFEVAPLWVPTMPDENLGFGLRFLFVGPIGESASVHVLFENREY
jgi:hypothetical protein